MQLYNTMYARSANTYPMFQRHTEIQNYILNMIQTHPDPYPLIQSQQVLVSGV